MNRGEANLFGQPEIQNLSVTALRHENVRRFDVAVNDALAVRRVQRVRNLDAEIEKQFQIQGTARDGMF